MHSAVARRYIRVPRVSTGRWSLPAAGGEGGVAFAPGELGTTGDVLAQREQLGHLTSERRLEAAQARLDGVTVALSVTESRSERVDLSVLDREDVPEQAAHRLADIADVLHQRRLVAVAGQRRIG